jgi:Zn-dependent protease
MNFEINYEALLIGLPIFIISGSIHEFAHAFFADIQGDPTARMNGRLTINPIAHVDLIGTILFPVINILTGFKIFGWMRPVPTNPNNFENPSKGQAIVAFAGPFSNFVQASIGALLFKIIIILKFYFFSNSSELFFYAYGIIGKVLNFYISINILLITTVRKFLK